MPEYMLFVARNDANCARVLTYVLPYIYQVEVVTAHDKPASIRGVPSLMHLETGKVFEGSECVLQMILRWQAKFPSYHAVKDDQPFVLETIVDSSNNFNQDDSEAGMTPPQL